MYLPHTAVRVTFVTSNVEVDESAGKVKVCLRKDGESFEDVILSIQSRERIPQQANNANGIFIYVLLMVIPNVI